MNPLLAFIIQEVIRIAPSLVVDLIQILSKPAATEADWAALKAKWEGKKYEDYDPPVPVPTPTPTPPAPAPTPPSA